MKRYCIIIIGILIIACGGNEKEMPILHLYNNTDSVNGMAMTNFSLYGSMSEYWSEVSPVHSKNLRGVSPGARPLVFDNMSVGIFYLVVTGTHLVSSSTSLTVFCEDIEFKTDKLTEVRVGPGNSECTISGPM